MKPAMETLLTSFVPWLSPFTAYLADKGLQKLFFSGKEPDLGEVEPGGTLTIPALPSQV